MLDVGWTFCCYFVFLADQCVFSSFDPSICIVQWPVVVSSCFQYARGLLPFQCQSNCSYLHSVCVAATGLSINLCTIRVRQYILATGLSINFCTIRVRQYMLQKQVSFQASSNYCIDMGNHQLEVDWEFNSFCIPMHNLNCKGIAQLLSSTRLPKVTIRSPVKSCQHTCNNPTVYAFRIFNPEFRIDRCQIGRASCRERV